MQWSFKQSRAPLRGSIDAVHNGRCQGWALDPDEPSAVAVEVFVDGQPAGQALADRYRGDLQQAGLRDGRLAFDIELADAVRDGRHHRVEVRSRDGRVVATRDAMQIVPKLTPAEFERHAPWIDAAEPQFEQQLADALRSGRVDADSARQLRFFREHGWLLLEQAIPHALIDQLLQHVEQAWHDLPPQLVLNNTLAAPALMRDVQQVPGFRGLSTRYLDFHNTSDAAAEIMMLPAVLRFAERYFGAPAAAMQTLLFENGTQQRSHQDFAYVHSLRPACLLGAWAALEDARADAGPLFYWDGSHRGVPKFVFDDGSVLAEGDGPHVRAFEDHLERACSEAGLERLVFLPRKGDVLLWHSALVHGGMPRNDAALTRKSIVSHYTTQQAYPYDRRCPNDTPLTVRRNGGIYYGLRRPGHVEGRYARA